MSEEEYWQSDPDYTPDLPSSFLSDEDIASDTNVIFIPRPKIDLDLLLDNYTALISRARTKNDLKISLRRLWHHAMTHGSIMDRIQKIQEDVDSLQYDLIGFDDYDSEYDNEGEEYC